MFIIEQVEFPYAHAFSMPEAKCHNFYKKKFHNLILYIEIFIWRHHDVIKNIIKKLIFRPHGHEAKRSILH